MQEKSAYSRLCMAEASWPVCLVLSSDQAMAKASLTWVNTSEGTVS